MNLQQTYSFDFIEAKGERPNHNWQLRARTLSDLGFPVPTFQPTTPNKCVAVDIQPSGPTPVESPGNGFSWLDVCDADVMHDNNRPVNCARVAMKSTGAHFGHVGFNGASAKSVFIETGGVPVWGWNSAGHFYPVIDNAFQIGSGANRPSAVYSAIGVLQTCDAREKDVLGEV